MIAAHRGSADSIEQNNSFTITDQKLVDTVTV
jgi:hypothetical protein